MHRAAAPPLAADELEQGSPERNVLGVEAAEAGDLALERGPTGCEPAQARKRAERLREQELHQAFVQQICQQQRPVEIDDERNVGWRIQSHCGTPWRQAWARLFPSDGPEASTAAHILGPHRPSPCN